LCAAVGVTQEEGEEGNQERNKSRLFDEDDEEDENDYNERHDSDAEDDDDDDDDDNGNAQSAVPLQLTLRRHVADLVHCACVHYQSLRSRDLPGGFGVVRTHAHMEDFQFIIVTHHPSQHQIEELSSVSQTVLRDPSTDRTQQQLQQASCMAFLPRSDLG
jgi:hypothetical protein